MRTLALIAALMLSTAPVMAAEKSPALPAKFIVKGKTLQAVPMAAWEDANGKAQIATGKGQIAKAPAKAVKFSMKSVAWPSGTVKEITFSKGGVFYPISDETQIYVKSGSITANIGGAQTVLKAGDVAVRPTGNLTGKEAAVLVTWNVDSLDGKKASTVVRGADVKDPAKDAMVGVKRYEFPGNSIRVASMLKGGKNGPASAKTDSLIYLKEGHVRFFEGDEVHDVVAGDFIWEEAGQQHRWEHVDGGTFVTTSALPKGSGPIDPSKATDLPPR